MSKRKKKRNARAEPQKRSGSLLIGGTDGWTDVLSAGYTKLSDNPEIRAGVNKIADLVSSMTIHLMQSGSNGDTRVRNELSRKIDISPNTWTTRKTFIGSIVRSLLLEGDGNAVVIPETVNGYLENLDFIPASRASFIPAGRGYQVVISGGSYDPSGLLHFVINPDPEYPWKGTGYKTSLKDVAESLKQAQVTKKGFMESKWMPSIIVKVDAMTKEFASADGRSKLLKQYIETNEAGEPWMIPADGFDVTTVTPLSLTDIALPDSVKLDKRTVGAILDVPAFVLGEGNFNADEWNNFINTRIRTLCNAIEQELTKKIIVSPDWYFKFNIRSLYTYDIKTLSEVGSNLYTRGLMTGNEVRDWLNLSPLDGLDELVILENYIPAGMIGDQKKLTGEGGNA